MALVTPSSFRRTAEPGETIRQEFNIGPGSAGTFTPVLKGDPMFRLAEMTTFSEGPVVFLTDEELAELPPALRKQVKKNGMISIVESGRSRPAVR